MKGDELWYKDAIFYGLKVRSLFDSDGDGRLPAREDGLSLPLDVYLLEKGLHELSYEMNNRPTWLSIPLRGILDVLDAGRSV